jgi:hypothetical protein
MSCRNHFGLYSPPSIALTMETGKEIPIPVVPQSSHRVRRSLRLASCLHSPGPGYLNPHCSPDDPVRTYYCQPTNVIYTLHRRPAHSAACTAFNFRGNGRMGRNRWDKGDPWAQGLESGGKLSCPFCRRSAEIPSRPPLLHHHSRPRKLCLASGRPSCRMLGSVVPRLPNS